MKKLFENIEGNKFKLISESITEDEPKSALVRKGLKKVFSEGEREYSYKKLESIGLGYIRNVSEAKKCALQEARELALEFGYEDNEEEQKFVKENDISDSDETKELKLSKLIWDCVNRINVHPSDEMSKDMINKIKSYCHELYDMHNLHKKTNDYQIQ